jgi:phage shock protein C
MTTKDTTSDTWSKLRALTLPKEGSMIGGVCAAFGSATPIPAWMWRVAFCAAALGWGVGVGVYLILVVCIPDASTEKA